MQESHGPKTTTKSFVIYEDMKDFKMSWNIYEKYKSIFQLP